MGGLAEDMAKLQHQLMEMVEQEREQFTSRISFSALNRSARVTGEYFSVSLGF